MTKKFFEIEFKGGSDLIRQIADVELEMKELAKAIAAAKKAGDGEAYKQLRIEQENLRKSSSDLRKALRDSVRDFEREKAPVGSLVQMRNEYSKLIKEVSNFTKAQRESAEGIAKIKLAGNLKKEILDIDQAMGNFTSNIGNYKSAFLGLGDILTGGLITGGITAAIGLVASGVKELFVLNSQISDLKADVSKVSGLTADEVDRLTESLIALDTRTSIEDLLKIAQAGGRLGIQGVEGLDAFTQSIDKVAIALGDDLGGDTDQVITELGKLSNVLFGVTTDGEEMATRLLAVGNSLNVLAASGQSQAGTIVDISNRISSLLGPLGATEGEILGLAAAMDELAINPERGGSSMVRVIQRIGTNLDDFSERLGINKEELKNGFDTQPVQTFQMVAKRAFEVAGNSSSDLVQLLKELGLNGVGVNELFLKLGTNSERVSELIDLSTQSFTNYASIQQEVDKKNENLAGTFERLSNRIKEGFIGSGIEKFFLFFVNVFDEWLDILDPIIDSFSELFSELFGGVDAGKALENVMFQLKLPFQVIGFVIKLVNDFLIELIKDIKGVVDSSPQLQKELSFISNAFGRLVEAIKNIPATLAGLNAGFKQFLVNLRTLDFSKSITEAFSSAKENYIVGSQNLKKERDLQLSIEKKQNEKAANDLKKTLDDKVEAEKKAEDQRIKNKKEAEARYKKLTEDQAKAIAESEKKIQELSVKTINNVFDKQIAENNKRASERIKKLEEQSKLLEEKIAFQGGKSTADDNKQSGLIQEETKAINEALEQQNKEVNEKRKEAFTNAKLQLESLQRENLKAIANLSIQDSTGKISDIKQESSRTIQTIELKYDQDQNALDNLFANNLVSQEEYTRKSKALEIGKQSERLEIEKSTNQKILDEQERLYKIQLELIKATENIAISKIDEDLFRDQEKAYEDFKSGRIASQQDLQNTLDALEDKANIDRSQVFQDSEDKEKDAINTVLDAKIAADNAVIQSEANVTKNQITEAEKRKKINQEVLQASLDIAQLLSNSIFELTNQDAEREKETKLTALEEEYEKKIELAQGNKTLEEALKAELEAKKLEIEKKAFERQKKLQIAQALINAAVAATAIFTVPDFTFGIATAAKLAALAITTATSIASIKKQQFADGGKVPLLSDGKISINPNTAPTAKGDNILAYVKRGEVILNEDQQEAAGGPDFFRRLNVPGFAEGGRVPNLTGVGSSQRGVGITDEQMIMFANIVANQTYEAVYKGSAYGASDGTFKGQQDTIVFNQKRESLQLNTEF